MLVTSRTAAREPTSRRFNTHENPGPHRRIGRGPRARSRGLSRVPVSVRKAALPPSKNMSRVMILVLTGRWITRRKGDRPIAGLEGPHHRHPAIRTLRLRYLDRRSYVLGGVRRRFSCERLHNVDQLGVHHLFGSRSSSTARTSRETLPGHTSSRIRCRRLSGKFRSPAGDQDVPKFAVTEQMIELHRRDIDQE
jgi:hypothetical protein